MRALALLLCAVAVRAKPALDVSVDPAAGTYNVSINGQAWFPGGPTKVWAEGKLYSSVDGSLVVTEHSEGSGTDTMGDFKLHELTWSAPAANATVGLFVQFKVYDSYIVFEQRNAHTIANAGVGNKDGVATVFPSFQVSSDTTKTRRGALAFNGDMVGSGYQTFEWGKADVPHGVAGTAPLVVFAEDGSATSVLSPAYNFMAANQYFDGGSNLLMYGVQGAVGEIPAGFTIQTILTASAQGPGGAMMEWGDVLLEKYGKDRSGPERDMTLNYLGYSTDNGAYYYYYTEPNKTYEQTMIDVKAYADEAGIPYRHWLMDSWWYFKGVKDGVKNWTAMGDIFPHGIDYVTNKTGWPIVGHNRFWSANTDYAKQNGGDYDFAIDEKSQFAVPLTQDFWDFLMESSRKWGLYTYEQDWLDTEYDNMGLLTSNATLARTWLMQMGAAAAKNGLTIQYCMSHCRHMLQSVEIPAVTQARASGDYGQGSGDQWHQLGTTGMFAWALGIAPSKDNFWSTRNADGGVLNPRYKDRHGEPYSRIQSAVITMSRGPVAPSDQNGKSDVALIMRSCMKDGTLLQLDRPAFALDAQLRQRAFGAGGPAGRVWSGFSVVARQTYAVLFAASLTGDAYSVTPAVLTQSFGAATPLPDQAFVAFETNSTAKLLDFAQDKPIQLAPKVAGQTDAPFDFSFYSIAPVFTNGWALLGEQDKWISVSADRFTDVTTLSNGLVVKLRGTPTEVVNVSFKKPDQDAPLVVSCTVPQSGTVKIVSSIAKCTEW